MNPKHVKLKISPDGHVQAEVLGFKGKKCADYISVLEQMLDAEAIDSERTAAYYLEEDVQIEGTILEQVPQTTRGS